jgi:signal transduction histidine kinase
MKLSIQHLQRTWQEDPEKFTRMFPKVLRSLLAQIDSLVNIANSFSEFAKMPEPKKSAFVLNDVLWEAVDLYGLTEEVEIIADIPETDLSVFADREQLARAIHNVIKNALQAIEGNGIIRVSAKPAGKKVYIDIQDNGSGIAEDLREKIFQPNFSTKSSGMGLGLAIVKKIIENAGGSITFISEAAEGTTFHIELPLLDQA